MKIKYKLMLAMLGMSLILFFFNGLTVLQTVYQEMLEEKCSVYSELTSQALRSFENISDDVEFYFFDACKTEGIGNIIALKKNATPKKVQLRLKLSNFVGNNASYLADACIVDLDGNFFFSAKSSEKDKSSFVEVYQNTARGQDVQWIAYNNDVLLCRAIYTLAPYVKQGYIIGRMNVDYLRSMIGMDIADEGTFLVLTRNGNPLFGNHFNEAGTDVDRYLSATDGHLGQWIRLEQDHDDVFATRMNTARKNWGILFAIPHHTLMARYYSVLRTSITVYIVLVLLAILLALVFSHGMTKNISNLMKSINRIHDESLNEQIIVKGHDEIAELATKYNWLLDYVNEIHKTEYELLELKYRFIQSQISPHFISNILSSISSYSMMGKTDQMEELCIKTSRYLKNNLRVGEQRFISVSQELNNVSDYIEIYGMISAVDLCFKRECPHELEDREILSMMLQPLVENALLHATNCREKRRYVVRVHLYSEHDWLFVDVIDNGCGMSQEALERIESIVVLIL